MTGERREGKMNAIFLQTEHGIGTKICQDKSMSTASQ